MGRGASHGSMGFQEKIDEKLVIIWGEPKDTY